MSVMDLGGRREPRAPGWTFLSNHGHVLICIAGDPDIRISEIAERVGIGVRAAQGIVNDLVEAGYINRAKVGRRNRYTVDTRRHLRHPVEADHRIGELIAGLTRSPA
jgi:predicted ArsR family transcriptional regulator